MRGPAERSASGLVGGVIGGAIVSAIALVAVALISGVFSYVGHQSDVDAKMIELSVGILRSEPTQDTQPLRVWAIGEMEKRGAKFTEEQRAVLLKQELPFKPGAFSLTTTPSGATLLTTTPSGTTILGTQPAPAR
jgi:hypothetical protein